MDVAYTGSHSHDCLCTHKLLYENMSVQDPLVASSLMTEGPFELIQQRPMRINDTR